MLHAISAFAAGRATSLSPPKAAPADGAGTGAATTPFPCCNCQLRQGLTLHRVQQSSTHAVSTQEPCSQNEQMRTIYAHASDLSAWGAAACCLLMSLAHNGVQGPVGRAGPLTYVSPSPARAPHLHGPFTCVGPSLAWSPLLRGPSTCAGPSLARVPHLYGPLNPGHEALEPV